MPRMWRSGVEISSAVGAGRASSPPVGERRAARGRFIEGDKLFTAGSDAGPAGERELQTRHAERSEAPSPSGVDGSRLGALRCARAADHGNRVSAKAPLISLALQ